MISESPISRLRVGDLPARRVHAHPLLRAERLLVEVDRRGSILDGEHCCEGVVALRNRLDAILEPLSGRWQ